jgi:hypothetical protein
MAVRLSALHTGRVLQLGTLMIFVYATGGVKPRHTVRLEELSAFKIEWPQ